MRGLLADVNVQRHALVLRHRLESLDPWPLLVEMGLTLANKTRFEHERAYAERVATDVAELLFGIAQQQYRDRPRIYVPL